MKTAVTGEDRRWPHRLQSLPARLRPALRLPAQGLPAVSGQDQGQGRAAVPLHPPGLLPRPQLPQSRRSQRPAAPLARSRSPMPGVHATTRRVVARPLPRSSRSSSRCRGPFRPSCGSNGGSRVMAWSGRRQLSTACRIPPGACAWSRCTPSPTRCRSSRPAADCRPPRPRGPRSRRIAGGHCRLPPPANSTTPRQPLAIPLRPGEIVQHRPLEFYAAVAQRLANDGGTP